VSDAAVSLPDAFAAAMDRMGPFEPRPALAVAVSGGADSMALALLTHDWATQRGGTVSALVVDHGLRAESTAEARLTIERLGRRDIPATLLRLTSLRHGAGLAERARIMRYQCLEAACRARGWLHLLLGHHAADQAETMMIRVLGGSMTHGLAAMPAITEMPFVRVLRPLLGVHPTRLRDLLQESGVGWVEDPSNADVHALRPRLRQAAPVLRADDGPLAALLTAGGQAGHVRAQAEAGSAAEIARRVTIRPEGFALLSPGSVNAAVLSAVIHTISGSAYAPGVVRVAGLAARPKPATLAGVRLLPAGRMGDGWLIVREENAMADAVTAEPDAVWDGRFRLLTRPFESDGTVLGALGDDAARFRNQSDLPSVVLRTLPALRRGKILAAVPHLQYATDEIGSRFNVLLQPPKALATACFAPV
jgi:tRNA(Ile)-lysidine synthase